MTPASCDPRAGSRHGFTVIELLLAMAITLLLAGSLAGLVQPARAAFERVPAELDLQQRGRAAIDVMAQAVRSAGMEVAAAHLLGHISQLLPVVSLADPDASGTVFTTMSVMTPVLHAAQGVLDLDQPAPGGVLTLAATHCPNIQDVCGFTPGAVAVVADAAGHFDLFIVSSVNTGSRRLTPDRPLSRAFAAGSFVAEIEQSTFSLDTQSDGSQSLIRTTAAGAVQPIVDHVTALSFVRDARAMHIAIAVQASSDLARRGVAPRTFNVSVQLRNGHDE